MLLPYVCVMYMPVHALAIAVLCSPQPRDIEAEWVLVKPPPTPPLNSPQSAAQ